MHNNKNRLVYTAYTVYTCLFVCAILQSLFSDSVFALYYFPSTPQLIHTMSCGSCVGYVHDTVYISNFAIRTTLCIYPTRLSHDIVHIS